MDAPRRALEAAGVEFTTGGQPGFRLTKAAAVHSVEFTAPSNLGAALKSKVSKVLPVGNRALARCRYGVDRGRPSRVRRVPPGSGQQASPPCPHLRRGRPTSA